MALGRLRRQADRLAIEGARLARERDRHARRSVALAGEAISSPAALALLFAAGFVVGAPRRRGSGEPDEPESEGRIGRMLAGPAGAMALRAALAFLAGASSPARGVPPVN